MLQKIKTVINLYKKFRQLNKILQFVLITISILLLWKLMGILVSFLGILTSGLIFLSIITLIIFIGYQYFKKTNKTT